MNRQPGRLTFARGWDLEVGPERHERNHGQDLPHLAVPAIDRLTQRAVHGIMHRKLHRRREIEAADFRPRELGPDERDVFGADGTRGGGVVDDAGFRGRGREARRDQVEAGRARAERVLVLFKKRESSR